MAQELLHEVFTMKMSIEEVLSEIITKSDMYLIAIAKPS